MLPENSATWEEQDEDERANYKTVFYNAFQRTERSGSSAMFCVGDTVAVETVALYKRDKKPSIAVIVAIWELVAEDGEEEEDRPMMVRIHWFLRPTELASIRVKRDHLEVCGYFYSKNARLIHTE